MRKIRGVVGPAVVCPLLLFAGAAFAAEQPQGTSAAQPGVVDATSASGGEAARQHEHANKEHEHHAEPHKHAQGHEHSATCPEKCPKCMETSVKTASVGGDKIGDYFLTSWVIADANQQIKIAELAKEKAQNTDVKKFAEESIEAQRNLIAKLHGAGLVAHSRPQADLAPLLQKLATKISQHGDGERIVLGFRGIEADDQPADDAAADRSARAVVREEREDVRDARGDVRDERQDVRGQRQDVRDERQDVRGERRDDPSDEAMKTERNELDQARDQVGQARDEVRDARETVRDEARETRDVAREQRREELRERAQELMPVIRENLPMILEFVGKTIEEGKADSQGQQWLQLKQQLAERRADSMTKSLGEIGADKFDEAFLHYQCLAHQEFIDTLELFKQQASDGLHPTLDEALAIARQHLDRTHQLMGKSATSAAGSEAQNPGSEG